ncbi:hypothetical protein BSLA_01r1533 [Burkholderia stabilis]|nr:hypothetical protein BSLA_01r1533 [Burkholderia stabilis]
MGRPGAALQRRCRPGSVLQHWCRPEPVLQHRLRPHALHPVPCFAPGPVQSGRNHAARPRVRHGKSISCSP